MRSSTGSRILRAWVAIREQFRRTLQICEQDRDLFALAFERTLRGEDSFGKVLWGVGVRRRKPGPCDVRIELGAALAAELLLERIGGAAGSTHSGQS